MRKTRRDRLMIMDDAAAAAADDEFWLIMKDEHEG
jgi:hypothetical protein